MLSKEQVLKRQTEIFQNCQRLVEQKGSDYNRQQQNSGDTLFNLRVAYMLGVVESPAKSVMIRILDKVMRMVSLTDHDAVIKKESIQDTVEDIINYSTYWLQFKEEEAAKSIIRPVQRDFEPNFSKPSFETLKNLKKKIEEPVLTGEHVSQMLTLEKQYGEHGKYVCTCDKKEPDTSGYCKNCKGVIAKFREKGEPFG